MPERPLVLFGKPEDAERFKKHPFVPTSHLPSYSRQKERLAPQLQELQFALDRGSLAFQNTPDGIDPEYTLVFEAYGNLESFLTAIRKLQVEYPEVELLFETDREDVPPDEDFYLVDDNKQRDGTKTLTFKLFCVLTNLRALQEIQTLWKKYQNDEHFKFPRGKTGLRDIFNKLKDIHLWGLKERFIETGTQKAWEDDLADPTLENIKCEIELAYRKSNEKRNQAEKRIEAEISRVGGRTIAKSCITEIGYHAILAEIPRQAAQEMMANPDISLLNLNEILFVNPTGQTAVFTSQETFDLVEELQVPDNIENEPILALFDGLPQEHHPILENFLVIDDPDDYTSSYEIKDRQHGTAMASLIAWGELNNNPSAIKRKIYVRPIMTPRPSMDDQTREFVPDDVLLVDKLHIAIRRLFEPRDKQPIPTIKIINLSIGINNRPFLGMASPLAKLLDWLSFKYKILFIVSAGNYSEDIDLGIPFSDFSSMSIEEKDKVIIQAINNRSRNQKILSPAESINSITTGSLFSDHSNYTQMGQMIMPCSDEMPSPYSALGRGINHSIKPDLLIEGGRNIVSEDFIQHNLTHWRTSPGTTPPGILHAKPVFATGSKKVGYSYGTSNSAAILSHHALKYYEIIDDVFVTETDDHVPSEYVSLLLKAMLLHGAKWDNMAAAIGQNLEMPNRGSYCDKIHKFIGYGVPDIERVKECTKNRITLIGYGELEENKAHVYAVPLPFVFSTRQIQRNLTVTMAFLTPVIPNIKKYRQAQVWFNVENYKELVNNRIDANDKAVTRGTIQHERFWGNNAVTWTQEDALRIKVNCREDAGFLTERIPYSIFITFEVAPEYDVDVYATVLESIKLREELVTQIKR